MTSSTDSSCRNDTDAVLVDTKDIVRNPKCWFAFIVDCKEFVGSLADMTINHANNKLPKVACTNKGGHKYHEDIAAEDKHRNVWRCELECVFCKLRIECRCYTLDIGIINRLSMIMRGVRVSRDMRDIHIRYANMKQRRLVA